jgi:hypothetical protein
MPTMLDRDRTAKRVYGDPRRTKRLNVSATASLGELGKAPFRVDLIDISTAGLRCEVRYPLPVGARVLISVPGSVPLTARVAWRRGARYGCIFDRVLTGTEVDRIVASFRGQA